MDAAGLVLGVIPLAIQALGTYRDIVSSMKNAKRDLDCLIRDLNTEQQILQNTCETLLRGIVPDSMLDDMIEDPFGPDWAHYNDEVRLRLWRSADLFQEQVEEMMQAAMQLRRKLAIGHNGKVRQVPIACSGLCLPTAHYGPMYLMSAYRRRGTLSIFVFF